MLSPLFLWERDKERAIRATLSASPDIVHLLTISCPPTSSASRHLDVFLSGHTVKFVLDRDNVASYGQYRENPSFFGSVAMLCFRSAFRSGQANLLGG